MKSAMAAGLQCMHMHEMRRGGPATGAQPCQALRDARVRKGRGGSYERGGCLGTMARRPWPWPPPIALIDEGAFEEGGAGDTGAGSESTMHV